MSAELWATLVVVKSLCHVLLSDEPVEDFALKLFMTTVVPSSKNSAPSFTDAVDGTSQTGQTRGHYESSLAV